MHFEDLWELCEKQNEKVGVNKISSTILDELLIKLQLYKRLSEKEEISADDKKIIKLRLFGEALYVLSNLSLIDEINVFDALAEAYAAYCPK